ncbi:MAG: transketolase [Desulfomonilaceae bacterium]|nr:transketolase [Desulfomonilaceae bacterium]
MTPSRIRRIVIDESKRANVGHIGSALSIADIVAVLFNGVMRSPGTDDPNRDRFILSKGHAALALYAALYLKGILSHDMIRTYCCDDSLLGVHPEHRLNGIDFSTGSLGHGLAMGAGVAMAARMKSADFRCFVLVSDAECNEGSLWETVMFAGHHQLSNLVAIIDDNGQQALGKTKDILDLRPLGDKWRAFGWEVSEVDGHDPRELERVLKGLDTRQGPPHAIQAHTISGKGVGFMEGKVEWHYLPLSDDQYEQALRDLKTAP